ncbi:beta-ketoacyl synthase N-terminal-like domain-containing protein [Actinomadura formosensis]|uniref:polyketide synthase family protein n=1 Tax=Actinomadura formosensis TaxID=60706 RepID=UPI003D8C039A
MSDAREPIAIVGAGAVFPGAGSAAELWRNILAGFDAISEVPPGRWDPALYYDPGAYGRAPQSDRFYCRRGGFVDELATFDPARFGITPAAVPGMEPDQLLALRTAGDAIADAGGAERLPDRSRIGVVIGRGGYLAPGAARHDQRVRTSHQVAAILADLVPELGDRRLAEIRRAFCARLGPDGPDASAGLVPSFTASRIADRFDLRGPAYTLDAACASSLLAVEHAVRALRGGQADAMLAGAVHHAHHATVWSVFNRLRVLSPTETIRPFDRAADGTLLAEGTGMVLLKRLSDAERAGDRVHAVILGAGSSSDGRAASILSPPVDGQVLAVERAWRDAGLDPAAPGAVGLVEAHGTGTPAGDEAELATLRRVLGTDGPRIGLGTVKSMIGHAMPAAGIAGLIKAAFALRDGVLPPTLHADDPHPALADGRLRLVREPAEWERRGGPRRAVVNAFGFGGVNAHVVLQEPPSPAPRRVAAALWAEGHGASPPPATGMRLDLGTPLVRLDGAVEPLRLAPAVPPLPAGAPVLAELEALLNDAAAGAQSVLEALGGGPSPVPAGEASTMSAELSISRVFSVEAMPYLADHCVVPQPPGWPDMSDRFPIVPLATLAEVMADTARELLPDMVVIGFENVRAVRWVVATPPTTVDIRAYLVDDGDRPRRVKVVIPDHADGTVLLADRYPSPPAPDRTPLTIEGPPIVTAERLYEERWMFQGPLFHGISEIRALAEDGVRAVLTSLPTPGALMDSAGQLCAHWIQVYGDTNQTVFPVGVERVLMYGPLPPAGERLETTVWNQSLTDTTMRCSAEMVRENGTVWGRIDGWTTSRFYTDEALWRMKFTPEVSGTGEPQPGGWTLARKRWDGAASRDLLMRQYLCAAERAEYDGLPPFAQGPWLLGRIAAKDAVRDHLWRNGHGPLFPAELTVQEGPAVTGPFDEPLTVSIASDAELGVALVRPGHAPAGIGLAVNENNARIRAAKQAVLRSMNTGPDRPEPVVTVADAERLLIAANGTVTTVETRELAGYVVAWTTASGDANMRDSRT